MNPRTGRPRPDITRVRPAGPAAQVLSLQGGAPACRTRVCGGCPWRVDQTGEFPAEAFLHSAEVAYDASEVAFACHESGAVHPQTCAGFLLNGAEHNLRIRLALIRGEFDPAAISDGGHELHPDYRSMAIANGCDPQHPRLAPIRDPGYGDVVRRRSPTYARRAGGRRALIEDERGSAGSDTVRRLR